MSTNNDVSERKLRPIYDAIDSLNYKGALSQISKLQKKQPDALILKSLKALLLEKIGKSSEALVICNEVKERKPTDETVLQSLTTVYRSLGKRQYLNMFDEEIVQIYENAAKILPNNEEIASHMFMAMVRNDDYKGQQQAALKLHKTFGKRTNRYYFWWIMSLILQAEQAPAAQSGIIMTIAERMMIKAAEEKRLEEIEEVHLYCNVLLAQNKVKEALEVIEGDIGKKCKDDTEIFRVKQELLLKLENWSSLHTISKNTLIETNPDDWKSYLTYFDSLFHINGDNSSSTDGDSSSLIGKNFDEARELIKSLQEKESKMDTPMRGPYLAELEFDRRVSLHNKGALDEVSTSHIVDYFRRFASKTCCFEDLQPYLQGFSSERAKKLIDEFNATIDYSQTDDKAKIKNIYKQINLHKVERYFGLTANFDSEETINYANKLWKLYQDSLQYGIDLVDTEDHYGDEFIILGCHALIDEYKKKAILLLETALLKSKHNFQLQLLLIRLYQILGVYLRPIEIYKTMDIKHIQLDTMSHYIVTRSSSLAFYKEALQSCKDTLPIYRSNVLETPEMIVHAYKYGTYSKVKEFIEFRRELDNSLQRVLSNRESIRLEIIAASQNAKEITDYLNEMDISDLHYNEKFCESLRDNRDFEVMVNFNPSEKPSIEELTRSSPKLDNIWIKLFTIIPHILKNICFDKAADEISNLVADLEKLVGEKEAPSLTAEEKQLGKIVIKLGFLYIAIKEGNLDQISTAIGQFKLVLDEAYANVISEVKLLEFSWSVINRLAIFLEITSYTVIGIKTMKKLLGTKGKKSGQRELSNTLQTVNVSLKEKLLEIKNHLNALKEKVKLEEVLGVLLPSLKSIPNLEFCLLEEKEQFMRHTISRLSSSWIKSIENLAKEFDNRITLI
ncbi:820_t:CDS:10 [Ambispora leptoticha]|uniref:820_t:CDS:1 n=1 Tax=Ambispora leptoticha TaxID=144679 RepID=A0A9N8V9E8_9GLOM|nr:820_t:CDS:10 [Ambispora leptoticha]